MKQEFVITRGDKQFVLYAGLLDEAHATGLKSIKTFLQQIPSQDNGNVAICQATVETDKGNFSGLGDASPENVKQSMVNCLIRMAETRAKARALRDAVNVGTAALEELAEDVPEGADTVPAGRNGTGDPATEKQVKAIYARYKAQGYDGPAVSIRVMRSHDGRTPEQLTRREASDLLTFLGKS